MPSLIESLIGSGTVRPDKKRLIPTRRPLPGRPRDLLELFVALGEQASMAALVQSCDLRQADLRHLTYLALSRWPTLAELAQPADPFNPKQQLRDLLFSEEFRRCLVWRICDAYPERQRLLYVRIPRCAGAHFLHMASAMHPLFPPDLAQWSRRDRGEFIPALGSFMGRFNLTRTLHILSPSLASFIQAQAAGVVDDILPWPAGVGPRRLGDRLFTILREPGSLVLSQVNAILTGLAQGADASVADWRDRLGALPRADDAAGWKAIGRRVLAALPMRNPICRALGHGTAQSALDACRVADIEIADLARYAEWVTYTWNVEPEPAINVASQVLTRADLDDAETAHLTGLIEEDLAFYARLSDRRASLPDTRLSIKGGEL